MRAEQPESVSFENVCDRGKQVIVAAAIAPRQFQEVRKGSEIKAQRLDIIGNADEALEFWRKSDGGWFLSRREVAVHRIERD